MEQQERMRRDHAIGRVCAALLLTKHVHGQLCLNSEFFQSRMSQIGGAIDVGPEHVISAFSKVTHTAVSIAFRPAGEGLVHTEHKTRLPEECGTDIQSELAVFRELCTELLLEFEGGKFSVNSEDFQVLVRQITDWLGFHTQEVTRGVLDIYTHAMYQYVQRGSVPTEYSIQKEDAPPMANGHDRDDSPRAARVRLAAQAQN